MTVEELMRQLSHYRQDYEVVVVDPGDESVGVPSASWDVSNVIPSLAPGVVEIVVGA